MIQIEFKFDYKNTFFYEKLKIYFSYIYALKLITELL